MNIYYLYTQSNTRNQKDNNGGCKAVTDIYSILQQKYNAMPIYFLDLKIKYLHKKLHFFAKFVWKLIVKKANLNHDDLLLVQWNPNVQNYVALQNKLSRIILLVHDLEHLRMPELFAKQRYIKYFLKQQTVKQFELNAIAQADKIIVTTNKIKIYLQDNGVNKPIFVLGIWDYLSHSPYIKPQINKPLVIAGNLLTANFLTNLPDNFPNITAFGINPPEIFSFIVHYKGALIDREIDHAINGNFSFGLIWYGSQCDVINDSYKTYYNNVKYVVYSLEFLQMTAIHKISAYISNYIPVIIFRTSALSAFVEQNNIGIVIDNLEQIRGIISNMTKTQYDNMCNNVEQLALKLHNGYFFQQALNKALEYDK